MYVISDRHDFQGSVDVFCICSSVNETTNHYFSYCAIHSYPRQTFFRQDRQLFVTSCGKITWMKWAIYHYYCYY